MKDFEERLTCGIVSYCNNRSREGFLNQVDCKCCMNTAYNQIP